MAILDGLFILPNNRSTHLACPFTVQSYADLLASGVRRNFRNTFFYASLAIIGSHYLRSTGKRSVSVSLGDRDRS